MLQYRTTQLVQEFSFWPSSPPKQLGGIYEMRTYSLVGCHRAVPSSSLTYYFSTQKPGSLLEWENEW